MVLIALELKNLDHLIATHGAQPMHYLSPVEADFDKVIEHLAIDKDRAGVEGGGERLDKTSQKYPMHRSGLLINMDWLCYSGQWLSSYFNTVSASYYSVACFPSLWPACQFLRTLWPACQFLRPFDQHVSSKDQSSLGTAAIMNWHRVSTRVSG